MMNSFLAMSAATIFANHSLQELQDLKVILPSRRAARYFQQELSRLSSIPFFSPEIRSIDDFIQGLSGLAPADTIDLYYECYSAWKEVDPLQSFEKFLTWAPTLLRDFNLMDGALLEEPERLFKYLTAAESIKRWGLAADSLSDTSMEYFTFFDKMEAVYHRLQDVLPKRGESYSGMAYRKAAQQHSEGFHYFVGLNALSRAEEKIIGQLVKAGRAVCLWDTDRYYMEGKGKAGKKLREYKNSGFYGKTWNFEGDLLQTQQRNLFVYKSSSKTLQARLAVDLAQRSSAQSHAIVLTDDSDFPALFLQLQGLDKKINISGGVALRGTRLFSVFDLLFRLMGEPAGRIRTALVREVFSNELLNVALTRTEGESQVNAWTAQWNKLLALAVPRTTPLIEKSQLLKKVLAINDPATFLEALASLLEVWKSAPLDETPFIEILQEKIQRLQARWSSDLTGGAFRLLFQEALKEVSLPFEKEPDARVQVMSMLETRCLDFEEITFLSFLEGNIPSGKKNNSFIPYDALRTFGLPSYADQDAIMAYHFFRLLQRARRVNFIYTLDTSSGVGRKEKSRFLLQIEEDLAPKSPNTSIFYPEISTTNANLVPRRGIRIAKTPEVLAKMRDFLAHKGLSATSLTEYFNSPLGFYWRYVEGIPQRETDETSIGANVFGSIIHYVLEKNDLPYLGKPITAHILKEQRSHALEHFERLVAESHPDYDFAYGLNAVLKTLAKDLIGRYYTRRIDQFTKPFTIELLEKKFERSLLVDDVLVKVKGTVDKIERHDDKLVVIDYKTGYVDPSSLKVGRPEDNLVELLREPQRDKLRQLLFYNFLISEIYGEKTKYEMRIYSFRKLETDLILDTAGLSQGEVQSATGAMLAGVVRDLLGPTPVVHPVDQKIAEYSDFVELLRFGASEDQQDSAFV